MSKHTPGPWSVDGAGIKAMVRGGNGTIVAVRHRNDGDVNDADMHLIAAAPEMLEALERAREYFAERAEAEYFTDRAAPVPNEEMRILVEIDEVLAKAVRS